MAFNTIDDKIWQILMNFKQSCKDLIEDCCVHELHSPPTPLEFYRNYVSRNKPVLIKNGVSHWPAITKWTHEYLREIMENITVQVSVTPNGYADAINGDMFLMPFETDMLFTDLLAILKDEQHYATMPLSYHDCPKGRNGVYYIQQQNSNFTLTQYRQLREDTDTHIQWATEAFNCEPDAVNFWMGDKRAVTSMHKDHYENIYCVVKGRKRFILHPPTDRPFIPHGMYRQGRYQYDEDNKKFIIRENIANAELIPWICIDPLNPDYETYPLYRHAHRIEVVVEEGDILYLPSLWYHHVQQDHGTIAVNYWYDMDYGANYCYYQLLDELTQYHQLDHHNNIIK